MGIYISHREQDGRLARDLAQRLNEAGFDAWNPYEDVEPGDNWAKRAGQALERSDLIIFLITPSASRSEWLVREVEFAITSRRHENRVLSILVGSSFGRPANAPGILRKLPHLKVESISKGFPAILKELQRLMPTVSK